MQFYAGLDPAFAGLNAGAQCLDIAGAGLARLLPRRQNLMLFSAGSAYVNVSGGSGDPVPAGEALTSAWAPEEAGCWLARTHARRGGDRFFSLVSPLNLAHDSIMAMPDRRLRIEHR